TSKVLHWIEFSPDSRFLITDDQSPPRRLVFEVPSLNVAWMSEGTEFHPAMAFSHDSKTMFAANKRSEIEAYDSATGKLRAVMPFRNGQQSDTSNLRLTRDRRYLWVHQDHANRHGSWLDRLRWLPHSVRSKNDGVMII